MANIRNGDVNGKKREIILNYFNCMIITRLFRFLRCVSSCKGMRLPWLYFTRLQLRAIHKEGGDKFFIFILGNRCQI